jgi:hypothetical protein
MLRQLVALRKIVPEVHGIPYTPNMLDWINFHREYNGAAAAGALVKCGGRVYVDPMKFLEWMATNPRISPPMKTTKLTAKPITDAVPRRSLTRRAKTKPERKQRSSRATVENAPMGVA